MLLGPFTYLRTCPLLGLLGHFCLVFMAYRRGVTQSTSVQVTYYIPSHCKSTMWSLTPQYQYWTIKCCCCWNSKIFPLGQSITVKGIAWGGGGLGIARVDVSLDNGQHFTRADLLEKPIKEKRKSQWSWQFFEKTMVLSDELRWPDKTCLLINLNAFQGKAAGWRESWHRTDIKGKCQILDHDRIFIYIFFCKVVI